MEDFEDENIEEEEPEDDLFDIPEKPPNDQDTIFSIEDLKNAKQLRSSQVAPWLLKVHLPTLSMTPAYRRAVDEWVGTHITTDELLSNHSPRAGGGLLTKKSDPFELAREQAKLALMKTKLSASKKDTRQSWWGTLDDNLMYAYDVIHNRTHGPQRERILNIKKITSTEQTVKTESSTAQQPQKKKSWIFG